MKNGNTNLDTPSQKIRKFLGRQQPFDHLPADLVDGLAAQFQPVSAGSDDILSPTLADGYFYIIATGTVEVLQDDGTLLNRLGPRDMFGYRALLQGDHSGQQTKVSSDATLYRLNGEEFVHLCYQHPRLLEFFSPAAQKKFPAGTIDRFTQGDDCVNLMTIALEDLVTRNPVALPPDARVRQAAKTMMDKRISSVLVVAGGKLRGIVTDRDLRSRVIAAGLSYDRPISDIMTADPFTADASSYGFEALLSMARRHIHHLPVMDDGKPVGMITATDLLERRSTSAVYLIGDIYKRQSSRGLAKISRQIPNALLNLVEASASAHSVGHVISAIGEAITCRLLELAESKFGSPPVPYAWIVAGSMARFEQTALSDQDNALLLSDEVRPEHDEYFKNLAEFVCDGLNECGYVYCPGDIMAMTDKWRQPLATWRKYFDGWIDEPEPKALMLSSIFFDMRAIYGDNELFQKLNRHVLAKSGKNGIFLAFMTSNALTHRPPLGFFRNFVLIKDGEHNHTLDLKHNGVVPIIDLARIYALAGGIKEVNTDERLKEVAGGQLSKVGAADLRDAFEYISNVRLAHQANAVKKETKPDNFVSPKELSHFERNHLKDAFALVRTMQASLVQHFQT